MTNMIPKFEPGDIVKRIAFNRPPRMSIGSVYIVETNLVYLGKNYITVVGQPKDRYWENHFELVEKGQEYDTEI